MSHRTSVTVTIAVRVNLSDAWGEDCTMGQILAQASDSATRIVTQALRERHEVDVTKVIAHDVRTVLVGEP